MFSFPRWHHHFHSPLNFSAHTLLVGKIREASSMRQAGSNNPKYSHKGDYPNLKKTGSWLITNTS